MLDFEAAGCAACYGDLGVLTAHLAALPPGEGPLGVFLLFRRSPLTIAVDAAGPYRTLADFAGHEARLLGHGRDAARLLFPAAAHAAGLDRARLTELADGAPLGELARRMLEEGAAEGVFGFANTILASLEGLGHGALGARLRFLDHAEPLPGLTGNALIVSRALLRDAPEAVRGLCAGLTAGLAAAVADPEAGVAAVAERNPAIRPEVELRRWRRTIALELAHPEAAHLRPGEADPARLAAAAEAIAAGLGLPRVPPADEIASAAFLPRV